MSKSREHLLFLTNQRAIKDLWLIGNLSNKSNYSYDIDDC